MRRAERRLHLLIWLTLGPLLLIGVLAARWNRPGPAVDLSASTSFESAAKSGGTEVGGAP